MAQRSGADLLMSHFVSSETPEDPLNQAQIERFEAARAAFPHLRRLDGQFVGHVPRALPDLRPGAARLRALRRQSDAGALKPDAAGRHADRGDPADPPDRGRPDLRLQRPVDGQAPDAARDPHHRLRRRPAARRGRDRREAGRRGRGRRAPGPAGRAGVDGPDHCRPHRRPRRRRPAGRPGRGSSARRSASTSSPPAAARSAITS